MSSKIPMSIMLYKRLNSYLHYMKQLPLGDSDNISSTVIAAALGVNNVQVRKDLAIASDGGKPRVGHMTKDLIADLEHFLGYDNCSNAVLVGAGNMGNTLLSYDNLEQYGIKIVAAFDCEPDLIGTAVGNVKILDVERMADICRRLDVNIGIVAVPPLHAQEVCEELISGGIRAVWNFAPVNLSVPETVTVKNEDMATSLAILRKQLAENIEHFGFV